MPDIASGPYVRTGREMKAALSAADLLRLAADLLDKHSIPEVEITVSGNHSLHIRPYRDRNNDPSVTRLALEALAVDIGATLDASHSRGEFWSISGTGQLGGYRCYIHQRIGGGRASIIGLNRDRYRGGGVYT